MKNMKWLNEPKKWEYSDGKILIETKDKSDFWRNTYYGYIHDDGHFMYQTVKGDFSAIATFRGEYRNLYDQAGIMLRVGDVSWIKAGIEFADNRLNISTVVTRDYSDWSVIAIDNESTDSTIRITRYESAIVVHYLDKNKRWQLLRLTYLDMPESCDIGLYCCSPVHPGLRVVFHKLTLTDPVPKE